MTTGTFPSDIDILSTGAPRILADGLGSTMAIVDSSGNSQKSYQYDVYGEVTGGSGSLSSGFDFAGQQTDGTGLQYLRARYYDPGTGTFLVAGAAGRCSGLACDALWVCGRRPSWVHRSRGHQTVRYGIMRPRATV
jgi:RHS repeat-associated protein